MNINQSIIFEEPSIDIYKEPSIDLIEIDKEISITPTEKNKWDKIIYFYTF